MNQRTTTRTGDGFSLVTGPGRAPLTRRQTAQLGRVLGTVAPAANRGT